MENQAKLGAALLGGYVLGRTKKGGFAMRLATKMLLSGQQVDPTELARDNVTKLLSSGIVEQLREQAMEVAKAALDARLQGIAQNLTDRTGALKAGPQAATEAAGKAGDSAKGVTDTLTGKEEEEPEGEQSDEEDQEAEGEAEEPEAEDEGSEDEESEEEPVDEAEEDEEGADEPDDDEEGPDEPVKDDEDEPDEEIEERAKALKRERIETLQMMADELGFDADDTREASKTDLAFWIAEAEAEDASNDDEEDERPAKKAAKKPAKKAAKKPAKKAAKRPAKKAAKRPAKKAAKKASK